LYKYEDKFFLYEYIKGATETRLHHNYILGIAGHINPVKGAYDQIWEGMMREWDEEVNFQGNITSKKLVGILNDDRRDVERVHLGLIYVFEGNSDKIEIKEVEKMQGRLMTIEDMQPLIGKAEYLGWAPLLFPYLKNF
jgi:predicted NUDIX family phosphoesterase